MAVGLEESLVEIAWAVLPPLAAADVSRGGAVPQAHEALFVSVLRMLQFEWSIDAMRTAAETAAVDGLLGSFSSESLGAETVSPVREYFVLLWRFPALCRVMPLTTLLLDYRFPSQGRTGGGIALADRMREPHRTRVLLRWARTVPSFSTACHESASYASLARSVLSCGPTAVLRTAPPVASLLAPNAVVDSAAAGLDAPPCLWARRQLGRLAGYVLSAVRLRPAASRFNVDYHEASAVPRVAARIDGGAVMADGGAPEPGVASAIALMEGVATAARDYADSTLLDAQHVLTAALSALQASESTADEIPEDSQTFRLAGLVLGLGLLGRLHGMSAGDALALVSARAPVVEAAAYIAVACSCRGVESASELSDGVVRILKVALLGEHDADPSGLPLAIPAAARVAAPLALGLALEDSGNRGVSALLVRLAGRAPSSLGSLSDAFVLHCCIAIGLINASEACDGLLAVMASGFVSAAICGLLMLRCVDDATLDCVRDAGAVSNGLSYTERLAASALLWRDTCYVGEFVAESITRSGRLLGAALADGECPAFANVEEFLTDLRTWTRTNPPLTFDARRDRHAISLAHDTTVLAAALHARSTGNDGRRASLVRALSESFSDCLDHTVGRSIAQSLALAVLCMAPGDYAAMRADPVAMRRRVLAAVVPPAADGPPASPVCVFRHVLLLTLLGNGRVSEAFPIGSVAALCGLSADDLLGEAVCETEDSRLIALMTLLSSSQRP